MRFCVRSSATRQSRYCSRPTKRLTFRVRTVAHLRFAIGADREALSWVVVRRGANVRVYPACSA